MTVINHIEQNIIYVSHHNFSCEYFNLSFPLLHFSGGVCVCASGFTPNTAKSECIAITLGFVCTENSQCASLVNSQCKDGTCQCNTGYKASSDGSNCYQSKYW
jgi:hypothetical protein